MLIGCTEDFIPNIDVTPVLCINSLVAAGEPITVKITRSWLYTDDSADDCDVKDATVTIYANGNVVDDQYIPDYGDTIRIVANSPTYGSAEAEVNVPAPVPVRIDWKADVKSRSIDDTNMYGIIVFDLKIDVEVQDPAEIDNYYKYEYSVFLPEITRDELTDENGDIIWAEYPSVSLSLGMLQYDEEPIFSEHIGAFDSVTGSDSFGFTYFTDRQFAGKTYTLHLNYPDCTFFVHSTNWRPELLECGVNVTLNSISQSLYNWANYFWQQDEGIIGALGDIGLGDPLYGYSNVSTSAGVVAALSSSSSDIDLSGFLMDAFQR